MYRDDNRRLALIVLLAIVHGLFYVLMVPAWQHPEEPNHFEYVWLTANLDTGPKSGDYDQKLSYKVVESMLASGFFDGMAEQPVLESPDQQVSIPGYSQLDQPILYYWLASVPLRFMSGTPIEYQLAAARGVSFILYLAVILAAWGTMRALAAPNNPLRWMAPLTIALLPGFTDQMTAVSNSVAAVTLVSFFIWFSVRLIKRGFSWLEFLGAMVAALLGFYTKNTAIVAIMALPVVFIFMIFRGKWRWPVWWALVIAATILILVNLSWDDAAGWYRSTSQAGPIRVASPKAVIGDYVFSLDSQAAVTPRWHVPVSQLVPVETGVRLGGKQVTLGYWMWASQPIMARSPTIATSEDSYYQTVSLDEEPAFFVVQADLPEDINRVWVALSPRVDPDIEAQVFYDGLVLLQGDYPAQEPPSFDGPDGATGEWGGAPFQNLLRNASAEVVVPRLSARLDDLVAKVLPDNTRPSFILASVMDWPTTGIYYRITAQNLFETFWGAFGWSHVRLADGVYWLLFSLTLFGCIGVVAGMLSRNIRLPWGQIVFLAVILCASWGITLLRGTIYIVITVLFVPTARYAYPVIIPTVAILCFGWLEIYYLSYIARRRPKPKAGDSGQALPAILFVAMLIILDGISLLTLARFYHMI